MAQETHAAEASGGMPQLDFSTFPNQIFWLVVTLIVIYFLLAKIGLPRIASIITERRSTIERDLEKAEEFKRMAAEAEAAYHQALADARSKAQEIIAANKAEIQADLDAAMAKADAEISVKTEASSERIKEVRAQAREAVREVAQSITGDIVSALVPGDTADAKAVDAAVAERMKG